MQKISKAFLIAIAELGGQRIAEKRIADGMPLMKVKPHVRADLERILAPACRNRDEFGTFVAAVLRGVDRAIEAQKNPLLGGVWPN